MLYIDIIGGESFIKKLLTNTATNCFERIKLYENVFLFEKIPFWQLEFDTTFSL